MSGEDEITFKAKPFPCGCVAKAVLVEIDAATCKSGHANWRSQADGHFETNEPIEESNPQQPQTNKT